MRNILRTAVIAGVGALAATIATPASACCAGHSGGNASIVCFGCGTSTGTADLTFTGVYSGWVAVRAPATATFAVNEPAGVTCVVTGTANGTVTGVLNFSFNWTRLGALAVVTTTGDVNGAAVAAFAVTSPVGNPCGGPVTASVNGIIAGL